MFMFSNTLHSFFFSPKGKLRYANNSNYKNDVMIRKEVQTFPSLRVSLLFHMVCALSSDGNGRCSVGSVNR